MNDNKLYIIILYNNLPAQPKQAGHSKNKLEIAQQLAPQGIRSSRGALDIFMKGKLQV